MLNTNEITVPKNRLLNMVNQNDDLKVVLEKLKEYILKVMERDIPYININTRQQLANCIIDCINKGWEKGYFTPQNVNEVMIKVINSCQNFYEIPPYSSSYGTCGYLRIGFNFKSNFALSNMRHIMFHEITHSFTPIEHTSDDLGFYKESQLVRSNESSTKKNINGLSVKQVTQHFTIIDKRMITFLWEVIAEATACDLADTYMPTKEEICHGIYSDWKVHYNRSYQQLGYEFLKTLKYDNSMNERELFKELTIKAINGEDIVREILRTYQIKNPNTWKDDLHEITTTLGEIVDTHNLIGNIDKVNRARELMKKYTPSQFRVTSRTDTPSQFRVTSRTDTSSTNRRR